MPDLKCYERACPLPVARIRAYQFAPAPCERDHFVTTPPLAVAADGSGRKKNLLYPAGLVMGGTGLEVGGTVSN
jgi:hypothetical protein